MDSEFYEKEDILKRLRKANYRQSKYGKCLLCGKSFQRCEHDMKAIDFICKSYKHLYG